MQSEEEIPHQTQLDSFENNQIKSISLPQIQQVQYESLQRNLFYSNLLVICILFGFLFLSLCITVFISSTAAKYFFYLLPTPFLIFGFWAFAEWKEFPMRGYAIRDHDILIKEGWLWRSTTIIPFNRIQHIELNQGPIDRMFELSELTIHTAGHTSAHALNGLTMDQASKLKEYIMLRAHDISKSMVPHEQSNI